MNKTLGITGGIACGKSAFAGMVAKILGIQRIDTDRIAKDLMTQNAEIRHAICDRISSSAYYSDGSLNRDWIRKTVFENPEIKSRLEKIVHPAVRATWRTQMDVAREKQEGLIVEIPLLFELQLQKEFDDVIVVAASEGTQIQRLLEKRDLKEEMARKILASQMTITDKINLADHVVWNDSGLDLLECQAEILSESLL